MLRLDVLAKLFLLSVLFLLSGCGSGGAGVGAPQAGSGPGASTAAPSYSVRVRVSTGLVQAQTVGPLSTITRIRVEIFPFGVATPLLPALDVPITGADTEVTFAPVPLGNYVLRATGFNSNGATIAGPVSSNVQVATTSAVSQTALVLQVSPVQTDYLYVAAFDEIDVYTSDPVTGALTPTPQSPFLAPTGSSPEEIVAGPGGNILYVNYFSLNQIARYQVDSATGDLALLDTTPTGPTPSGFNTDPQKEFLFVPQRGDATVRVFRINQATGALTEVANSPFHVAGSTNPQRAYTDPQGRFLFVTDFFQNGELFVMKIDRTTGDLTQTVGPFQAFPITPQVHRTYAVTTNPAGTIAYVAGNFNEIAVYDIDQTSGFLSRRDTITTGSTNIGELIFDSKRRVMYALGFSDDLVRTFQLDTNDDIGAEVPGSPVLTGGLDPLIGLLTPDGNRLYVTNFQTAGQVSAYLPDPSGVLAPVTGQPFSAGTAPEGLEFLTFQTFP